MRAPTERFSDRAEYYAKYRPGYPDEMLQFLRSRLTPPSAVADIGSGTGILTRLLLDKGYELYAVEPNEPMRCEAERILGRYPAFHSVRGTAEATTLRDRSMDLITCAQAFHWFDREKARAEFCRILKSNGMISLIWNERLDEASEINREYDEMLKRMAPEYKTVIHRQIGFEEIRRFFTPGEVRACTFPNDQILDREQFLGRLISSSFVPNVDQPGHEEIVEAAGRIFDAHQTRGEIMFKYETKLYLGRIG